MAAEPLRVVCSKWQPRPGYRSTFTAASVNVLRSMVARHFPEPHEFVCITDDPAGIDADIRTIPIWNDHHELRGPNGVNCYRRLRLFTPEMRELIGPRFVHLDLDVVICGDLRPLWCRPEEFVIWGDTAKCTPYNGSMFLMTAGSRARVWQEFDPATSPAKARALGYIGSDQAHIGAVLGWGEAKWDQATDGVYSWRVHLKAGVFGPPCALPANARVVVFHGKQDPWDPQLQADYSWIAEHYR